MHESTATQNEVEQGKQALAPVDLRSDTVTKPTPAMRRAMAEAEVGDDVYGEDPTVNRLQTRAAEIFERDAALFVPSGSMGNLISIKIWTQPGSEVICEERGHINQYEMASMSAIAGCLPRTARTADGLLTWELIQPLIRPKTYYISQTALVSLENTHNMAGGTVYDTAVAEKICDEAHAAGLKMHLDGARIFNAAAARWRAAQSVARMTRKFDSLMFCLSKGLGAPVGSMVVGAREFIEKARVYRKMFGGGMRQAGVLAAAGLIALEESPKGLPADHENAHALAVGLSPMKGIHVDAAAVVTNIVVFDVQGTGRTAAEISAELKKRNILANPTGPTTIRMVTHYDVDHVGIERALEAMREITRG
ncbi:MAG: low specificity L-threonine aldolase [Acidobacteria bacterium]|nr:low specificity L-threonine aldolase [Acidobacteriota bacterium]MBI3663194.1 low specificity L-threonine aldolase [Acidobacteriota bacterium]